MLGYPGDSVYVATVPGTRGATTALHLPWPCSLPVDLGVLSASVLHEGRGLGGVSWGVGVVVGGASMQYAPT